MQQGTNGEGLQQIRADGECLDGSFHGCLGGSSEMVGGGISLRVPMVVFGGKLARGGRDVAGRWLMVAVQGVGILLNVVVESELWPSQELCSVLTRKNRGCVHVGLLVSVAVAAIPGVTVAFGLREGSSCDGGKRMCDGGWVGRRLRRGEATAGCLSMRRLQFLFVEGGCYCVMMERFPRG